MKRLWNLFLLNIKISIRNFKLSFYYFILGLFYLISSIAVFFRFDNTKKYLKNKITDTKEENLEK